MLASISALMIAQHHSNANIDANDAKESLALAQSSQKEKGRKYRRVHQRIACTSSRKFCTLALIPPLTKLETFSPTFSA